MTEAAMQSVAEFAEHLMTEDQPMPIAAGPNEKELALILAVAEAADNYVWNCAPPRPNATGNAQDLWDAVHLLRHHREKIGAKVHSSAGLRQKGE